MSVAGFLFLQQYGVIRVAIVCHQVIMLHPIMTEQRAAHREESLYDPRRQKCVYGRNIVTNELFASIITDRGVIICRVQRSNALR